MRPSQPASAPSSASRIASAVVRAATPATSGARPASASRQRRSTAFFSSQEGAPPSPVPPRLLAIAPLLGGSGASALAYQLVWTRELRLVFGHSTAASAAVLAIFIGGGGAGAAAP